MADLIEKMNYFLDEKELIALSRSEKDIKNIEALYALNDAQTKAKQSELTHTVREKLGEK